MFSRADLQRFGEAQPRLDAAEHDGTIDLLEQPHHGPRNPRQQTSKHRRDSLAAAAAVAVAAAAV